jgi:nucleotide-binding universal stress UspA family protein
MAGTMIVGYDGTQGSRAALGRAIELGRALGDELVLAFAYEPPAPGAEMADHRRALAERGHQLIAEAARLAEAGGVKSTAAVIDARPAEGLIALAEERGAHTIVVGGNAERPLLGVVLGATPYKLLHRSRVPILVVPTGPED